MKRKPIAGWWFMQLTTILALMTSSACHEVPQKATSKPPEVGVDTPVRRDVIEFAEFTGTTRAVGSVDIRARATGRLEKMTFEPSQFVRRGDALFVIEPQPYEAAVKEAEAALASAVAELDRAQSDLERLEFAVKKNAVSKSDVDLARAQRDMAKAAIQTTEARLDTARLNLSYTVVRSPIAGQVGLNLLDVGNLVSAEEGSLLTTVKNFLPIYIYFDAPEEIVLMMLDEIGGLRSAARAGIDSEAADAAERTVFVATLADDDFPLQAYIDYVDNTVNPGTGTIQLRAVFPNEELKLFPGLFVRVRVPLRRIENAVLVDERAVGADLGGKFIYVLGSNDVVEQRYLEFRPVQDDGFVPVLSGLQGDERYVRDGIMRARPGMPVTPAAPRDRD